MTVLEGKKELNGTIRRANLGTDLWDIANLIEMCFGQHLDEDGRYYIRQIRRAAGNRGLVRWVQGASEKISAPVFGYVWEENNRVVGNLSLVPFRRGGIWTYLIANVAVHPDYQRQGIGRRLTERGLQHIREKKIDNVWLQARADNKAALNLYRTNGFVARATRTDWVSPRGPLDQVGARHERISVRRRRSSDWEKQRKWLAAIYPRHLRWYYPLNLNHLKSSLLKRVFDALNPQSLQHWSAFSPGGELIGTATWSPGRRLGDHIWIAAPENQFESVILPLLEAARRHCSPRRRLVVNFPAYQAERLLEESGFKQHNTLVWMEWEPEQETDHDKQTDLAGKQVS